MVCDKNCEKCPFPDCINDEMDLEDYEASAARDRLLCVKVSRGKPLSDRGKQYYRQNREKCLAYSKAYYMTNKLKIRSYQKEYYLKNHERILLRQRRYDRTVRRSNPIWRAPNIDALRCLIYARVKRGLSQSALGKMVGVSQITISNWERGIFGIAHMDKLIDAMPELKDMIGTKCEDFCDRSAICDRQDCYYSHIKPRAKKENPPADVEDRQAEGVSAHLPHDNK